MRATIVFSEVGQGLRRNPGLTIAVTLTVLVAGVLGGLSLLLHQQVSTMQDYWYDKVEVSVFLCSADSSVASCGNKDITAEQRDSIRSDLQSNPQVQTVYYESKEEAYQHFKEQFANNPDIVNSVPPDSLPESFRVKLKDPTQYAVLATQFAGRPGVEQVQDERAIFDKLFRALNAFQTGALIISGMMVVAALLLIGNTIRVAAFTRRRETGIMRLVGASNLSIRLPFLLESLVAALAGAVLAVALLAVGKLWVIDHIFVPSFRFTNFIGWDAFWFTAVVVVIVSMVLSAAASMLVLRRYLRV
jgi:cell division transport system permease protein